MIEFVGIFWFVEGSLVAVACPLKEAVAYGDCLTYDGGHAEHWERWQKSGVRWLRTNGLPQHIAYTDYEEHPRGRIVKEPDASFYMPIVVCKRLKGWQRSSSGLAY